VESLIDGPWMRWGRLYHQSVLLHDGRVLTIGGQVCGNVQQGYSVELFDLKSNTWQLVSPMNFSRIRHSAITLLDGRVLVSGGQENGGVGHGTRTAEVYDPASNTWTVVGEMTYRRHAHHTTLLGNGQVLIVGGHVTTDGNDDSAYKFETAEIFDPEVNEFYEVNSMSYQRTDIASVLLDDGRVLVIGDGLNDTEADEVAEIFDPTTGMWTQLTLQCTGRGGGGANNNFVTSLPSGIVLWFASPLSAASEEIESDFCRNGLAIDVETGAGTPAMLPYTTPVYGAGARALLLGNGNLLLTRGETLVEMNPLTGMAVVIEGLNRSTPTLVPLANGGVLIIGGVSVAGHLSSTSIYYPLLE